MNAYLHVLLPYISYKDPSCKDLSLFLQFMLRDLTVNLLASVTGCISSCKVSNKIKCPKFFALCCLCINH